MPPYTQQPRPEGSTPPDRPAPGQRLGSQQRTALRAAPSFARAPLRAPPLSKHSGCAPPPRPRRPFPRYLPRAHLGLRGHPWPGPTRTVRFRYPVSRFTSGTVTRVIPGAPSAPLGSARPGAVGPASAIHCHPQLA